MDPSTLLVRPAAKCDRCGLDKRATEVETAEEDGVLALGDESDPGDADKEDRSEAEPEEAVSPLHCRRVYAPTPEEVRVHRLTHLPFREWCPECVAGAADDHPHHRRDPRIRVGL